MRDYSRSIFSVCEDINGSVSGSGDPLSKSEIRSRVTWLEERLEKWTPSKSELYSMAYDGAVRMLVIAAIQLGEASIRRLLDE